MKKWTGWLLLVALMSFPLVAQGTATSASADEIVLDGKTLNLDKLLAISRGAKVRVADEARKKTEAAFEVLLAAARGGMPIYGFTTGVGLNKKKTYVKAGGEFTEELVTASKNFNRALIRAHVGAIGEPLKPEVVRTILAIRLNMLLTGSPGIEPAYLDVFVNMLNRGVLPIIPSRGSIGQADITVLAHMAWAMIGEGNVSYQGKVVPAATALKQTGIILPQPYAKDGLALLSTSAYSLALAVQPLAQMRQLIAVQPLLFALSLEALDGNVSPILADNVALKGFPYGEKAAQQIRDLLQGSYLWSENSERPLQDPLSFRDAHWLFSVMNEAYDRALGKFLLQVNHGDDNPAVAVGVRSNSQDFEVSRRYFEGGAVFSSSNFDPFPWALDFEYATIAVAHNSNASALRISKLDNPTFTKLSDYLGTSRTFHAFGAMEKPPVALVSENRVLANPASINTLPVAGTIEDIASNAPLIMRRLGTALDNYAYILGMELTHAAQAIDLRLKKNPDLKLSPETRTFYQDFRRVVQGFEVDKPFSEDFERAKKFVEGYQI